MSERLPPLNALKAFEAAARHLSVTKAALELNVSAGAVSHQIRNLEEHLGVQLFHRLNHGLSLTAAGQAALPLMREGFGRLAEAVQQMRGGHRQDALRVAAPPSFAAKWLVGRLSRFAALHPGLDIMLSANQDTIDEGRSAEAGNGAFRAQDIDLAIWFGTGQYPGCRVEKLFAVSAVPLCSPRLLTGEDVLRRPDDLRHHTLLHDDTAYAERPDWGAWLAAMDVRGVDASRGLRFNHAALALEAAAEGQGVALSLRVLALADLATGRLVMPFEFGLPLRSAYYIVSPEAIADRPDTVAFRQWLLAEARAEGETAPAPQPGLQKSHSNPGTPHPNVPVSQPATTPRGAHR
jgi:LysR family glycine cleavage system transcriptional activator